MPPSGVIRTIFFFFFFLAAISFYTTTAVCVPSNFVDSVTGFLRARIPEIYLPREGLAGSVAAL